MIDRAIGILNRIADSEQIDIKAASAEAISILEQLKMELQRSSGPAFDKALKAIDDLRVLSATDFKSPNCQGQRGADRCDALYDAYSAVHALAQENSKDASFALRADHECYSARQVVPNNDRVVVLFDTFSGGPFAVAARYREGRWYGTATGGDLLIETSIDQFDYHWCEFPIQNITTAATSPDVQGCEHIHGTILSPYLNRLQSENQQVGSDQQTREAEA